MAVRKRTSRERAKRAEVAWRELELGAIGPTDKERIYRVLDGMVALDQEQQRVKYGVEELVEEYLEQHSRWQKRLGKEPVIREFLTKLIKLVNAEEKGPCLERTQQLQDLKATRTSRSASSTTRSSGSASTGTTKAASTSRTR